MRADWSMDWPGMTFPDCSKSFYCHTSNGVSLEISLSGILQALNHFRFDVHILHNCFSPSKEGVSVWNFRILKSSGHWPTGITTYLRHPLSECKHQPFFWKLIPFTSLDGSWVEQIIKTILMAHCQCCLPFFRDNFWKPILSLQVATLHL